MNEDTLTKDWETLAAYMPADLEASACLHGFVRRTTGRIKAQMWLRLILMHAAGGLSLTQTVARAKVRGWANVSSVALHKRLSKASSWLQAITTHLLVEQKDVFAPMTAIKGKTLRIVDASDIQEPGSTGTDLRLHYSLRLPDLACDYFEISDTHGGERLGRFTFCPDEVVIADRGYCHRAGVAQVIDSKADVVVRLVPSNFPLLDENSRPFNVLEKCASLKEGQCGEWQVGFEHARLVRKVRLCVLRKSLTATEETRRKLRQKSTRSGKKLQEQTLQNAAYVMILTTLPSTQWSTEQVLELYRSRWQIELAFKRLKSLLHVGHVPKSNDPSAKAWLQAKVLTALLIERLLCDSRSFSPYSGRMG